MTDLTIGGETFRVLVEGDPSRPPLMLSNSLGTTLSMWDGQMAALTKHFRVIRYDPRGHGGSAGGRSSGSIAQLGGDALAILDALAIEKVHWLGLSMGGAVGLWLLINAPDRIDRAVLANSAARFGSPEAWNTRIAAVLGGGMADNAAATIERWFSPAFIADQSARVDAVHAMLRATSPEGYAAACAALRDMDLRAALAAITHEVLVVTGDDDPVIPDDDADALIAGIGGARHAVLSARHMSNIEAQDDFDAAVVAFLTRPIQKTGTAPRKTAPVKATPVKRGGGAGRRSNPARNPLKKASAKGIAAKKPAATKARAAAKTPEPHRRPAAKRSSARPAAKASAKRQPKKASSNTSTTRRPTPTATARGPVKKAKPAKRVAVKSVTKAAGKKAAAKAPTKKLPAARRKPAKKSRRPTGRRQP